MKKLVLTLTAALILVSTCLRGDIRAGDAAATASDGFKMYGIGSISKVFTAAAVMKLVDAGKIDLDEPLVSYIPEFKMADERYALITPRMLLNHSSGLMGMTVNNVFLFGDNDTVNHDSFLDYLSEQTLKHTPGERSIYSNDSFTIAELLAERVSGISFTEFIEREFITPLGLTNIKTPQSDFDTAKLQPAYIGGNLMKPQYLNAIGTGGIYATMEDLCRFATIFTDSGSGKILSKESTDEMAKVQHQSQMVAPDSDTVFRYGLGWDAAETYPFGNYGIKALSKGGSAGRYFSNLTVLPEYNLAAAVVSCGEGGLEQLIAQDIILAVLIEEGILPEGTAQALPVPEKLRAAIPEELKSRAGLYDSGIMGWHTVEFTEDTLILTSFGANLRNERKREFIYNGRGEFISADGDYISYYGVNDGVAGTTALTFNEDPYILAQTYENFHGLGVTASSMPFAEKLSPNPVEADVWDTWAARGDKEYLLVNEKYTSLQYYNEPVAKIAADERVYGYIGSGTYEGAGAIFPLTRIESESAAAGFQKIPTMNGRDIKNLRVQTEDGCEYLCINNYRYADASKAKPFSSLGQTLVIESETIWADIDDSMAGRTIGIITPPNGAWFVYNDKMNCVASSLEENVRETVILPENGRVAFAGAAGAQFGLAGK